MSVTIDSLDIQIRSSAGSAAKNIDALAQSISNLNASAKVTKTVNALEKLNTALTGMRGNYAVIGELSKLSHGLAQLGAIPKLTGLQSAIRELKKLPEVMQKMSMTQISGFAKKMNQLAAGLRPLANQLDKIGNGFSKLPPQVTKCVTAVKRLDSANKSAANSTRNHNAAVEGQRFSFLAYYENLSNVFSMMHGIQDGFAKLMDDAVQWDGIQFRFGRAFGEDADMVLEYARKVSDELRINMQQFMQYSSLYGSLLSGFGMAQEQVTAISIGLTELSYDIWAAYNDRYRTLEDASEAVRSAITGEIEPIRNAGIALTEASMQEYLKSIGMVNVSVEKLTEAQKSELRYAVMVNSAMQQGIIGTYAREMDTAEGAVRTLTQQLKTLGQALGSLFLPILQAVLPWISAFVELLTEGIRAVAQFFGIKFQEIQWGDPAGMKQTAAGASDAEKALGGAAKNAKAMRDYAMGFDELNVINPSSGSGSGANPAGGGSLGLDLDTLWNDAVFASASKRIDEIKEKIKSFFDEYKVQLALGAALLAKFVFNKAWNKLDELFNISGKFKAIPDMFHKSWFSNFTSGLKMLKNGHISFKDFLLGITGGTKTQNFMSSAADLVLRFGSALKTAFTNLPTILANVIRVIPGWGWIIAAIAGVIALAVADYDFTDIGYKIGHALGSALKKVGEWLGKAGEWIVDVGKGILEGINAAWEWVKKEFDIDNVFELIYLMFNPVAWITKIVPKMIEIGAEVLPGLWQGIKDGWNNFWGNIKEFIDGFVQGFKDALGIHSPSKVFAEIGDNLIAGLLNGITEKWNDLKRWFSESVAPKLTIEYWKEKFNGVKQGVVEKLAEVKQSIVGKWGEVKEWFSTNVAPKLTLSYWLGKFQNIKTGFTQTIKNAVNAGIDLMNKFIGWINEKLSFSWDALTIAGKEVYPSGSVQLFTIPAIPRLADGGFVGAGQMFIAREAGPELVGSISGRTAVANNDQIVAAVSQGVYNAVVAAMGSASGGGQAINVYLDGKQIAASVRKTESERGRSLMGNQLGYAY